MGTIAEFYIQGGGWMHPITLLMVLTPFVCIADGATRGRFRLSSLCLALVASLLLVGCAGFLLGLKEACDGFAGVGLEAEQRQVMIAVGLGSALNAAAYAMMVAAPLLGLTMVARLFHLPQKSKTEEALT